jgi:protoporphyrin/coproporphyrin ferrochelatase
LPAARAATAGTHPAFVAAICDLLVERAAVERGEPVVRASVGSPGPSHNVCPVGCCPNLLGPRPALCGASA